MIKVSIVEDVDEIRDGLLSLINSSDELECIGSYSTAEEALKALKRNTPNVIIMDIGLPGMSGIRCTSMIKKRFPDVQIMICTVFEDDNNLFKALTAGANGYILKQTAPEKLVDSIKDLFAGGSPMSSQIARRVVSMLSNSKTKVEKVLEYNLSIREKEILTLIAEGCRNKDIANKLFVSEHTVKTHIYHIYEKLHVKSRVEALNKFANVRK